MYTCISANNLLKYKLKKCYANTELKKKISTLQFILSMVATRWDLIFRSRSFSSTKYFLLKSDFFEVYTEVYTVLVHFQSALLVH